MTKKQNHNKPRQTAISTKQLRLLNPQKFQNAVDAYRNATGAMSFIYTITALEIDKHVGKMLSVIRDENLISDLPLCKQVNNMRYVANKMISYLERRAMAVPISTHSWLNTYEDDYRSESRYMHNIQSLIYSSCLPLIQDLELKADVICINADVKSQGLLKCDLKISSWLNWADMSTKCIKREWKVLTDYAFPKTSMQFFLHQQSDMAKMCTQLEKLIGDVPYEKDKPMWQQFEQAEQTLRHTLMKMIYDDKFNDELWTYLSRDWLLFYFARAILDTASLNHIPPSVISELTKAQEDSGKDILQPASSLITNMAGEFHGDADPYDVIDRLQLHPVPVIEDLIQIALDRLDEQD